MRRRVTRRLIVIHAAWQLKTTDLESIFKTGKIRRSTEKSGEMVSLKLPSVTEELNDPSVEERIISNDNSPSVYLLCVLFMQ